jgi:hypothetical protein
VKSENGGDGVSFGYASLPGCFGSCLLTVVVLSGFINKDPQV